MDRVDFSVDRVDFSVERVDRVVVVVVIFVDEVVVTTLVNWQGPVLMFLGKSQFFVSLLKYRPVGHVLKMERPLSQVKYFEQLVRFGISPLGVVRLQASGWRGGDGCISSGI